MHYRGFPATSRSSELAAGLLDVVNEPELDDFVGAARRRGRRRRTPLPAETQPGGRRLAREHRRADAADAYRRARRRTPAGRRRPRRRRAARMFGVELEGMSPEDRDFEIARRFVRFAQAETARAARS